MFEHPHMKILQRECLLLQFFSRLIPTSFIDHIEMIYQIDKFLGGRLFSFHFLNKFIHKAGY